MLEQKMFCPSLRLTNYWDVDTKSKSTLTIIENHTTQQPINANNKSDTKSHYERIQTQTIHNVV